MSSNPCGNCRRYADCRILSKYPASQINIEFGQLRFFCSENTLDSPRLSVEQNSTFRQILSVRMWGLRVVSTQRPAPTRIVRYHCFLENRAPLGRAMHAPTAGANFADGCGHPPLHGFYITIGVCGSCGRFISFEIGSLRKNAYRSAGHFVRYAVIRLK